MRGSPSHTQGDESEVYTRCVAPRDEDAATRCSSSAGPQRSPQQRTQPAEVVGVNTSTPTGADDAVLMRNRLKLGSLDYVEESKTCYTMSNSKMKDITQEIVDEYMSSLKDLTTNNKAQINCLTILAEDYIEHAPAIVHAVEDHLQKVPSDIKLPVLYLIDSIVKNVNKAYLILFTKSIVNTFCSVFEKVDEHTRSCMWKLRQTWNDVFPVRKLYALDVRVHQIDPAWPIVPLPANSISSKSIHQQQPASKQKSSSKRVPTPPKDLVPTTKPLTSSEAEMREQLLKKRKELIELQKQKVELELLQARASLEQQRRQMDNLPTEGALDNSTPVVPSSQVTKPVPKKFVTTLLKNDSNKSGVKIAPASSIAIASAKPISRDPRLKLAASAEEQIMQQLKLHMQSKLSGDQSSLLNDTNKRTSEPELTTINNKSLDNKRAKESSQKKEPITSTTATTTTTAITDTTSTTTTSQRSNSISKDQSKSPSSKGSSRGSSSSSKSSSSSRKPGSKSRPKSSSSSPNKVPKLEENSSPSEKRSSSSKKSKSHKSSHNSPSPSPPLGSANSVTSFRIPRRAPTQESPVTSAAALSSGKSPTLDEEEKSGSLIAPLTRPPASTGATAATSFKEIKSNTRLRNYVRRNKEGSRSPDSVAEDGKDTTSAKLPDASKDEDLRPAIVNVSAGAALDTKDLDLRVLAVPTKRPSPEMLEASNVKKSKAEKFDALFGNEDVDLRTLTNPKAGRPPTPPPPMISSSDSKKNTGWAKLKTPVKIERDTPKPVDRSRDRLGRPRIHKSNASPEDAKDRKMRGPPMGRDPDRHNDRNIEIIMKDAAEQLDAGIITKAQYNTLIQEVLHMSEDQKLRAAQRKEAQESGMAVWEKGEGPPGFVGDDGQGRKPEHPGMHPRAGGAGGPRWQGPWHQPWAHPPPFPGGPPPHGFPDGFRPMGPWAGPPPRLFGGPMRPDFHPPFGFNPRMGPPPPMGPNGPIMMPNGPMGPAGPMNPLRPGGPMGPMPPGMMMNGPVRPQQMDNKRASPNAISATGPAGAAAPLAGAKHEAEKEVAAFKTMVNSAELPPADPKIIEEVTKDTMRSINIDGVPREIRYYGNIGIIFMHWDDPRDISFKNDTRRVIIDGKDTLLCNFNEDYREFTYDGEIHRIKLGTPTRELYVDDKWYQCYFGGQPITVDLGNKKVSIKLEGPPPEVKYGITKRTDLVLGKINLIINARNMVPVFLDAKPQMFEIEGKQCTLQFTDALQTVLLNGRPFKVEFGGLPKPIVVQGKKHFIRFSVLPRGFRAGHVRITGMAGEQPKEVDPLPTDIQKPEALVPSLTKTKMPPTTSVAAAVAPIINSSMPPGLDLNSAPQNVSAGAATSKPDLAIDILSSVMPSAMAPPSGLSYQAEPAENPAPAVTLPLNLDELFQKLVDTGIIPSLSETKKQEEEKKPEMVPVSFDKPESLKQKQPAMVAALYSGMQCSSCGERFATEMATRYSRHLDWHFRQNRRERDSFRKVISRPWFYDVSDWIQFEEVEDVDDRAQSWFETEKQTAETEGTPGDDDQADGQQPSVRTGSDEDSFCQVCHEPFEQFYNEEKEEWHLRPAVAFEEKNYHPLCLEDHKRALEKSAMVLEETIAEMEEESKKTEEDKDSTVVQDEEMKEDNLEVKPENIKTEIKEEKDDTGVKGKEGCSALELEKIKKEKEEKEEKERKENEEKQSDKEKEKEKPQEESAEANNDKEQQMDVDDSEPIEIIEPLPRKIELEEIDDSSDDERAEDAAKERPRRERRREEKVPDDIPLIFENVKVKEEPIDLDDEPEESIAEAAAVDTTQVEVKSSIDGNVELQSAAPTIPAAPSKIKINITKALPVVSKDSDESKDKEKKSTESPVEAAPAKPLIPAAIKPSLQGKKLSILPTVEKGHELSGLCSIM